MGGRPPTPTNALKQRGTFRRDRHSKRTDTLPATRPAKPRGLPPDASRLWDILVPWLLDSGIVQAVDRYELETLCRFWGLARAAMTAAEADPIDKLARTAATQYTAAFGKLAAKFGLTPSDRTRLELKAVETITDDKARFFKVLA